MSKTTSYAMYPHSTHEWDADICWNELQRNCKICLIQSLCDHMRSVSTCQTSQFHHRCFWSKAPADGSTPPADPILIPSKSVPYHQYIPLDSIIFPSLSGRRFDPLWKVWKSVGMMKFPIEWNNKSHVPVTTSQIISFSLAKISQASWCTNPLVQAGPHPESRSSSSSMAAALVVHLWSFPTESSGLADGCSSEPRCGVKWVNKHVTFWWHTVSKKTLKNTWPSHCGYHLYTRNRLEQPWDWWIHAAMFQRCEPS